MINLNKLKYELGKKESNNNYRAVNAVGALGRYQFLPETLNSLQRIYNLPQWVDKNNFLNSNDLQDLYFEKHIDDLMQFLSNNNLYRFVGEPVTGSIRFPHLTTTWNEHGMIAAMHLAGTGALKRYFTSGYNPNDGMTSLTDYGAFFSDLFNYDLDTNIAGLALPGGTITGVAFILAIVLYYIQKK